MYEVSMFGRIFTCFSLLVVLTNFSVEARAPRHVLLFIGDGMGEAHVELARAFLMVQGSSLEMDRLPAPVFVHTKTSDAQITDSAAAGTAIATGWKTLKGRLAVSPEGEVLVSFTEAARLQGYRIGIVTTTPISDATPAVFLSHAMKRNEKAKVLSGIVESNADILIGGSCDDVQTPGFVDKVATTTDKLREKGYAIFAGATESTRFVKENVNSSKVFVCLNEGPSIYESERKAQKNPGPDYSEIVEKAVNFLSRGGAPFILMVEGGLIDHAAHYHETTSMVEELVAFDKAVGVGKHYFQNHREDTLLVVTADHETGGLVLHKKDPLEKKSAAKLVNGDRNAVPVYMGAKDWEIGKRRPVENIQAELEMPMIPEWTSTDHTASPVRVLAAGVGAEAFRNIRENNDIGKTFWKLLELPGEPGRGISK
jgi:alkaline phosphatase